MRLQLGSVRRLGMLVCAVGFVWSLLFVSMMLNETSEEQSENLKVQALLDVTPHDLLFSRMKSWHSARNMYGL